LIEKTITINFLATDHGAAAAAIEAITRAVESAPGVDSKSVEVCYDDNPDALAEFAARAAARFNRREKGK